MVADNQCECAPCLSSVRVLPHPSIVDPISVGIQKIIDEGCKKMVDLVIDGSCGPGIIPAKNMFLGLKCTFRGRFKHTMYNPMTEADRPACLS
jgi:hypothetical protein